MIEVAFLSAGELPLPQNAWLARTEQAHAETLRFAKRRREWLQGRLAAKLLLARELGGDAPIASLTRIEIRSAEDGAPEARLDGQPLARPISISHRARHVLAATAAPGVALGADCELIEERAPEVAETFLRADELERVSAGGVQDAALVTLLWSAKESVLKALRLGLREDTRRVVVKAELGVQAGWASFRAHHEPSGAVFSGLWARRGRMILTFATRDEDVVAGRLLIREVAPT